MCKKFLQPAALAALMLSSATALALPFSSFDPRSMAMGSTGVAVNDPSTAPFFNPAMLSASDPSKKFSVEFISLGARLVDPGNMHGNLQTASDNGTLLTSSASTLTSTASTLATNTTILTGNISNLAALTPTLANLSTLSTNLGTVQSNLSIVSGDMATVSNHANNSAAYLNKINQALVAINNQPLQGELGAATVIGIPGKNWGVAFYADAWGAMGAALQYKDATTVSKISGAITTTAGALSGSSTAINSTTTALTAAIAAVNAANSSCNITPTATCAADLTAAVTAIGTTNTGALGALNSASTTLSTNAGVVTTQSGVVNGNTTLQSQVHLRGVAVTEYGFALSHAQVTNDVAWSWGVTPKVMQMRLYDATIGASTSVGNVPLQDYLAYYSTLNFDAGLAKTFLSGWRTGLVVKNVLPQTFDFKNAPTAGATPVANGSTFKLLPQVRAGLSYEAPGWFTVALDADLTKNDPAGLEDPSQFVALGGEFSTSGWTQVRAGYRADLVNTARNVASLGFGLAPRLPFFKPHFDFAIVASPDIFTNGWNAATQVGISLKMGINF